MAEDLITKTSQELPVWECRLQKKYDKDTKPQPITVGERQTMTCSGFESVAAGKTYSIKLDEGREYFIHLLSTQKDKETLKVFEITSYKTGRGQVPFVMLKDGKEAFSSKLSLDVTTVLTQKDQKSKAPPYGFLAHNYVRVADTYIPVDMIAGPVLVFGLFSVLIFSFLKGRKVRSEYNRVVSQSRYHDPFIDFNVEIRDFKKIKKPRVDFMSQLDDSLKKVFFRIFRANISLDTMSLLEKAIKTLGMEPHEVRSFYVLEEEYKRFKKNYMTLQGKNLDERDEFLDQAKKTISKMRRYVKEVEDV